MMIVRPPLLQRLAILAACGLVHAALLLNAPTAHAAAPAVTVAALPKPVEIMREALQDAVRSGRLEDLKYAMDLNELKPELSADPVPDPIAFWRKLSADGQGGDILAALGLLLDLPYSVQPLGKDPENTRLFIWPAFADRDLASLTAQEDAQLLKLEGAAKAGQMKSAGKYTGWRLVIGGDGVWHAFRRYD